MSKQVGKIRYAMSRRRRNSIVAAVIVLTAVGIWMLRSRETGPDKSGTPGSASPEQKRFYDFARYHRKTFTVVKVIDGDTLDIDIPDGKYPTTRIRLWGIDTPETKNPELGLMYFGPEAAEFSTKLALGRQVTVYLEKHHTRGKFGRLLAYVQLPDGAFLNEVLLSEGFAYADLRFRHSFYNKYKQLEAGARRAKRGLWEKVTREQLPRWLQRTPPKPSA